VLILAAEDYSGKPGAATETPAYASRTQPNYLQYYKDALDTNGISYDVYDVDAESRTAPDPLGVLSHYDAIVWYNRQRRADPRCRGARRAGGRQALQRRDPRVRDYLNDGGKLLYTGQNAAFAQVNASRSTRRARPPFCDAATTANTPGCNPRCSNRPSPVLAGGLREHRRSGRRRPAPRRCRS